MNAAEPLLAGIELGGTKSIALVARGNHIIDRLRLPTTDPAATLPALSARIGEWDQAMGPLAAIGIGSFGPLALDPRRDDFGRITTTPKPGWKDVDVHGHFEKRFAVPIGFDTDVAGAALAEGRWGAAAGCRVHVYLTIGTGIGGGVIVGGRPVHGRIHPEIGHIRVRRSADDDFPGVCPYHGDCLEGLASGPAIAARAGAEPSALPAGHPVWRLVAAELGELMAMLILTLSPERILIGGGVGQGQPSLLPLVRSATGAALNGYVAGLSSGALEELIRAPALGDEAGPLGAIALAARALETHPG